MESRCIGCRTCVEVCPEKALSFTEEGIQIKRELCTNCGVCSEECPSTAMELLGMEWDLDDLVREVEKDSI
ncbi:MAG: 4Fe-4S binding protein, partial [Thermodesulfobacteriota bacterium]|nr:4Fe-4S binding protein [Thermodesulfobacteriota bacterium]